MAAYLAELYVPQVRAGAFQDAPARTRQAALAMTREGTPVVLTRSIDVPKDDLWLWLFEADSEEAVWETARRAGIELERVVAVVAEEQERRG